MNPQKTVVFTDLDGTLIDFYSYSGERTKASLQRLLQAGIDVVFCSSKTFEEQAALQEDFGIRAPMIVENGSAIVAPAGFWKELPEGARRCEEWTRVEIGIASADIRHRISRIEASLGESLVGFSDLQAEDVARKTGLDLLSAKRAKSRDYSETLSAALTPAQWSELDSVFREQGLRCLPGGRFHTVIGESADKGRAVELFLKLLAGQKEIGIRSVGVGDSENDAEMLAVVDEAYLVQRPDGTWASVGAGCSSLRRLDAVGPEGWAQLAEALLAMAEEGEESGSPSTSQEGRSRSRSARRGAAARGHLRR